MNTIFTPMQDNSYLRWGPPYKDVYQGKTYLSKSITTPSKIKHLASKNILLLIYTFNTQCMWNSIYLQQLVPMSQPSHSVPLSTSHSLLTVPIIFTAILQHIIIRLINCIGYTALLNLTSGEMPCHAVRIHTDSTTHLYVLVNNTWNYAVSQIFSTDGVKNFKCVFRILCCVCGLISLSSWVFLWFSICRMSQIWFLKACK
jgi:hypothetical protein